ncbi:MAG: protein tyrosine phosphatase family protein [Magnetococcales bacterium]|nr:protein tyrosine phosphatase family protein [Magnetococcales bacterium]
MNAIEHIKTIRQFVPIDDSLFTGGQPSETQLAALAEAGFDVIINLALHDDPRYSLKDERGTVHALGMEYIHIPVPFSAPRREDLQAFLTTMEHVVDRRVFVHCAYNWRVSAFIALYRILRLGWKRELATQEMNKIWSPDHIWETFVNQMLDEFDAPY